MLGCSTFHVDACSFLSMILYCQGVGVNVTADTTDDCAMVEIHFRQA